MSHFIQLVVDGFASGSIYASLALALVLVNRATGMVNFAQGAMAALSAYGAWALWQAGVTPVVAVALALVLSFVVGALIQQGVVRHFEVRNAQTAVVVSIALFLVITGIVGFIWGYTIHPFPSLFPATTLKVFGAVLGVQSLGTTAVIIVAVVLLQVLFQQTKLGLALRAVANNPESSALSGIPVARMLLVGWGLAASLGALSGALIAPKIYLFPGMMDQILVYAFAAAIMGGLDSPVGAVVAAWIIGISENLAGAYIDFIGDDLKVAVPLVAMFVILLVRPQGLFGHKEVVRV
jgi:branched-chain amino acid transport system permease protein